MAQPSPEIPEWPALELLGSCAWDGLAELIRGRLSPRGATVVLKVPRWGLPHDAPLCTSFYREAHLLSRLCHPHVVRLVDVGDTDGRPYLVLEDVAGGDLSDRVKGAPLAPAEAARLSAKVARALHHVHDRGIILRGLSARAVRFTEGGEPKLYDFSMARELAGPPDEPGSIVGTPLYMAPEQAGGKASAIGPRTDQYGLGAVFYQLLTGRPPFLPRDTPLDTLLQVLEGQVVPPRRLRPRVPPELDAICLRCLEKSPEHRYPSAAALADDLRRFLEGSRSLLRERLWGRLRRALSRPPTAPEWPQFPAPVPTPAVEEEPVALRGWEWHYLQRRSKEGPLVLRGQRGAVSSLAFHPEGKHLATGSGEGSCGEVKVWRLRDAREVLSFPLEEEVTGVAFSPDGKSLACGGVARQAGGRCAVLRVWEVATGKEVWAHRRDGRGVTALAYHPDGLVLAAADCVAGTGLRDPEGRLRGHSEVGLWELTPRRASLLFVGLNGPVRGVAFGPRGKAVAFATGGSCSPDGRHVWPGKVQVRSPETNDVYNTFAGNVRQGFGPVAFNPADGYLLAAGASDLPLPGAADLNVEVVVWDLHYEFGYDVQHLRGHSEPVTGLAFSPDGRRLASASADLTVKLWDVPTGRELLTLRDPSAPVTAVAFSPDGHRLAAAAADGTVIVWDGSAVDHPSDTP